MFLFRCLLYVEYSLSVHLLSFTIEVRDCALIVLCHFPADCDWIKSNELWWNTVCWNLNTNYATETPRQSELISHHFISHTITKHQSMAGVARLLNISAHALTHTLNLPLSLTHISTEAGLKCLGTSRSVGEQSLCRKSKISFYGL